jgi:hypothetical protein
MTVSPSPLPNQDRQRLRRWWLIGGSIAVALLLIGAAAAVYAGTRPANDRGSEAAPVEPSTVPPSPSPTTSPPDPVPTEEPVTGWTLCMEVQTILQDMIDVDTDYVETRRTAADRLRELETPTPSHRALLDDFADELDAAAQMVEDDPTAELDAFDREAAASSAFINSGGCD